MATYKTATNPKPVTLSFAPYEDGCVNVLYKYLCPAGHWVVSSSDLGDRDYDDADPPSLMEQFDDPICPEHGARFESKGVIVVA